MSTSRRATSAYGPIMEIMELFTVVILQIVRYALSLNVSVLSGDYFFKICVFNVIGYIYIYIFTNIHLDQIKTIVNISAVSHYLFWYNEM
jgi:hypothetical protein